MNTNYNKFCAFIRKLFSSKSKSERLEAAVCADDIRKTYELLCKGADVNMVVLRKKYEYIDMHDYIDKTVETCLLEIAVSDPMRRLLKSFGALELEDFKKMCRENAEKNVR